MHIYTKNLFHVVNRFAKDSHFSQRRLPRLAQQYQISVMGIYFECQIGQKKTPHFNYYYEIVIQGIRLVKKHLTTTKDNESSLRRY